MENEILFKSHKELKELQNKKLCAFVTRQLYPFSPYYRALFDKHKINPSSIKTVKDLERIPFTSKDDFSGLDFVLQPDEHLIKKFLPKKELVKFFLTGAFRGKKYLKTRLEKEYRPIFLTATTGTTGQPMSFLYTAYDLDNLSTSGKRIIDVFGADIKGRAVNVFPYAPHLAFWQTVFAGFSSGLFVLSTGGGKMLGTEGNIRFIMKVKPDFLIGVPSYVYHMLKMAEEKGLDMSFIKKIALGASRVPSGFKKKITDILGAMGAPGVKVFGTYGFTESRSAWGECPTDIGISSGYHTYPDKEVFEIIDPDTLEVKGEGEDGEIVYSAIDARGSVVLRYRTGDLVKGGMIYSPCPHCGRTVPRLSSDIVRASNVKDVQFSKIKGTLVNINTLEHILDDAKDIDNWQIEIAKKDNDPYEVDEFILYVSLLHDVDKEAFMIELNKKVLSSAEVSFNRINFLSRKEMHHRIEIESSVKAKRIVDTRVQS